MHRVVNKEEKRFLLSTPPRKAIFLLILAGTLFTVPYLVAVRPVISVSYVVGFNNHVALLLFIGGIAAFAVLCGGKLGRLSAIDQKLPLTSLALASTLILLLCLGRLAHHSIGGEAKYSVNRLQMLATGLKPYRDFEYAYGPLHLYIPFYLSKIFHSSVVTGYFLWWTIQWIAGTAMLWFVIRQIDLPISRRKLLFWVLLAIQILNLPGQGIAYTPVRTIGSAFFLVLLFELRRGRWNSFFFVVIAIMAIVFALGISPEQAISVSCGLIAWLLLSRGQKPFLLHAAILAVLIGAIALAFTVAYHFHELDTFLAFRDGSLALPLLPSPSVVLILFAYIAAACTLFLRIRQHRWNSVAIPLGIGGFSLLPIALGRCDLLHLQMASGAFILGVATIEAHPAIRRYWSPLATCMLFVLPLVFLIVDYRSAFHIASPAGNAPMMQPRKSLDAFADTLHPANVCTVYYRTPSVVPSPARNSRQDCMDVGFYFSFWNVATISAIQKKASDISSLPLQPLILPDRPMADVFPVIEANPANIDTNVLAIHIPKPIHTPYDYEVLKEAVLRNYIPSPQTSDGYRIWYPKQTR